MLLNRKMAMFLDAKHVCFYVKPMILIKFTEKNLQVSFSLNFVLFEMKMNK